MKAKRRKRVVKPRVPRTHAGNKWTKSGYFSYIRSALRRAFTRYPPKYQVKSNARRPFLGGGRQKYEYQCAICTHWHKEKEVEVDHMVACGSLKEYADLAGFVERMFCEVEDLRILCKICHKEVTAKQREERK
jgi:hypothetical protein